jgi:cell division septum initiation protein DivIVA
MATAFRTVLRGYEPAQVDAEVATLEQALSAARAELGELTVQLKEAGQRQAELQAAIDAANARAEEAARARTMASRPTFADLGERIGQILTLAQEEGARLVEDATKRATQMVSEADRYAIDTRSSAEADAEAKLAGAQRRADELIDHADREAAARREEAEAVYESQQARAAQAAADFERTLADRRDAAAADFAVAMGQREDQLRAADENLRASENEALRIVSDASSQAEAMRTKAEREAEELVGEARAKADRVRRDSERELAAVSARRDSITAQLSNVRQMLATLGGGAALAAVEEAAPAEPEPVVAAADDDVVDEAAVEDEAVEEEQN